MFFSYEGWKTIQHRIQLYINDFECFWWARDEDLNQQAEKYIALEGPDILPEHCISERRITGSVISLPLPRTSAIFVENNLIQKPTPLISTLCPVRFDRHYDFQFFLPENISYGTQLHNFSTAGYWKSINSNTNKAPIL